MRNHLTRRVHRGFTLIELAVVVSIIAVLASILLSRLLFYHEEAEKTAMEQTLGTLRSALHLQIAGYLLNGKTEEISRLTEQNPMNWLAEKPTNYVGEYYSPKPGLIATGNWYFDVPTKNLVYLAHSYDHLHVTGEENKLRFQAKVVSSSSLGSVSAPVDKSDSKLIEGIVLEPVVSYQWF